MNEFLKKGSHISVMSHYQSGSYVNDKKEDVYTHSFICDEFRFLDKKPSTEAGEMPKNEN